MKISREETKITGSWIFDGSKILADEVCERIKVLTESYLTKVATDVSGWQILYKDPSDNRYWELVYLQGELQGGGPPTLIIIKEPAAKNKYQFQ